MHRANILLGGEMLRDISLKTLRYITKCKKRGTLGIRLSTYVVIYTCNENIYLTLSRPVKIQASLSGARLLLYRYNN
jgi:hypothetical protein